MRYLPLTDADRGEMLKVIGASSVAQLEQNVASLEAAPLTDDEIAAIEPYAQPLA